MVVSVESTGNMPRVRASASKVDDDVVSRARTGDESAWSTIVSDLGPVVAGYARARGVDDPEDVMQDVFVAAAGRLPAFRGDWKAFRSWIFGIAYRQIVNRYRAHRDHVDLPDALVDPGASPEDLAVLGAMASDAVAALAVLSEAERDVVLLRVVAGLDTEDVARAIGKRSGNVRVLQTRALAKLRVELGRRGYHGSERSGDGD